MIDTWQPTTHIDSISAEKLIQLAAIINNESSVNDDLKHINESEVNLIAGSLNIAKEQWIKAIEPLSTDQVLKLCRLFTVGEMAFPSWTFGSKNPTIYFLRHLKSNKIIVEKDFIRWLKKNTDNRYIPYGPAL
jgi:hypothetical protein